MTSMAESLAVNNLAKLLYDYLPANPHPYTDPAISFPGVAASLGLRNTWPEGSSKNKGLPVFLNNILRSHRPRFSGIILAIVQTSLVYRKESNQLYRDDVEALNEAVQRLGFKIPELHDEALLQELKRRPTSTGPAVPNAADFPEKLIPGLKQKFTTLFGLHAQQRGFAFEKFLCELFEVYKLSPRSAFRLTGEQIDGSFAFEGADYLVEAKWQNEKTAQQDLLVFSGKIGGKSTWSRGVFISYSGFSEDGLEAFGRGRSTNLICIDGLDLFEMFNRPLDLREVLRKKIRRAAETNNAFTPVRELFAQ